MRRGLKLRNQNIRKLKNSSRGYILITLMLFMSLVALAVLAILPDMVQQIKRDREEEMVHRGTEYMRAVKKYYKKFGRYPSRIEELENTNQQRFLRKKYKDPLGRGDKDFKLIHVGDPALNMLGMGGIGGIGPGPSQAPGFGPLQTPGKGGPFVGAPGGGIRQAGPDDANVPQVTGLPGQQNTGTPNPTGSDSDNPDAKSASSSDSGPAPGGQVFGGGPILGVASTNKDKSIREFNKKNHYHEWLFIYDPSADRGGLLKGPVQPDANKGLGGINPTGTPPGAPGQPGGTPQPQPPGPPGQLQPPEE